MLTAGAKCKKSPRATFLSPQGMYLFFIILRHYQCILPQHLPEYIQAYKKASPLESTDGYYHYEIACLERQLISNALRDNGGNRQAAARQLGIHRSLLYKKMKDLNIHDH